MTTTSWKQPGGSLGKFGLWVAGAIVLIGSYMIMPALVAFATNIFRLLMIGVGITVVSFLFLNEDSREAMKLMYLQLCKKIVYACVNPTVILENQAENLKELLDNIKSQVKRVKAVFDKLNEKLDDYQKAADKLREDIAASQRILQTTQDPEVQRRHIRSINKWQNSLRTKEEQIQDQEKSIALTRKYIEFLGKAEDRADIDTAAALDKLDALKDKYEQAEAINGVTGALKSLFGNGFQGTQFERDAINRINDAISSSAAEMESLIDGSSDIITQYEADSVISTKRAQKIIDNFGSDFTAPALRDLTEEGTPVANPVYTTGYFK